ncbi:MAG: hypothetical protein WBD03_01135 [Thermoplasmata archaeon]
MNLITENYPQLATAFMPQIQMFVLFFGGMIVASSTLEAAHRPGTYTRMMFGLVAVAFVCMWFFIVFGGGVAELTYGPYFVRFDMSMIIYIVIVGLSFKGLLVVSTFYDFKGHERERARKKRLEQMEMKARASRPMPTPQSRSSSFSAMRSTEFEVTADDDIDHALSMPARPVAKGMKVCEVCGAEAPVKDYVCRNCGEWFPSDSQE